MVRANAGDENVDVAIVVVVGCRRADRVSRACETGLQGDILKFHAAQVAKQAIGEFRRILFQ